MNIPVYYIDDIAFDRHDALYVNSTGTDCYYVFKVDNNYINIFAGNGNSGSSGDGGYSTDASIDVVGSKIFLDMNDNLYLPESGYGHFRKVEPSPLFEKYGINTNNFFLKYMNSTAEIFNSSGLHLKTVDFNSGDTLKAFGYGEFGKLISITNHFGEVTTITRDSDGNPTEITAPNGQKTYLTVDEQGNLNLPTFTAR
jgi:YD repeat-containing protein